MRVARPDLRAPVDEWVVCLDCDNCSTTVLDVREKDLKVSIHEVKMGQVERNPRLYVECPVCRSDIHPTRIPGRIVDRLMKEAREQE